jgi:hypothetical protein
VQERLIVRGRHGNWRGLARRSAISLRHLLGRLAWPVPAGRVRLTSGDTMQAIIVGKGRPHTEQNNLSVALRRALAVDDSQQSWSLGSLRKTTNSQQQILNIGRLCSEGKAGKGSFWR